MSNAYHDLIHEWKRLIEAGLDEDGARWDWTARACLGADRGRVGAGGWVAKAPGVWGAPGLFAAVEAVAAARGWKVEIREELESGARFKRGERLAEWRGPVGALLALERVTLNLGAYACGVAAATREMVDAVEKAARRARLSAPPRLCATRKTLPLYRDICVQAVIAGGGHPHRLGLSGGVLIKENHIAAAGGIALAVKRARAAAPHGLKIEVEVRDAHELDEALRAGADGVLLDNFAPARATAGAKGVKRFNSSTFVEISGGITPENAGRYVAAGVDVISSGWMTHSARAADISFLLKK